MTPFIVGRKDIINKMSLKVSTKAINTTCVFKVLSTHEAFHSWLLPIIKLQCQIPQ